MKKQLLIVFAKNIVLGKVKTRLAKTVGDNAAFDVYKHLIDITERETLKVIENNIDVHIYFSDVVIKSKWPNQNKFVQRGEDLGERMMNAFQEGFEKGYDEIIGVGADLPDLDSSIITTGFEALIDNETVFGPAKDGGYYLIGMRQFIPEIFMNKPWSTEELLLITLRELSMFGITTTLLQELNDIDTIEDLACSSIAGSFEKLIASNTNR